MSACQCCREQMRIQSCKGDDEELSFSPPLHDFTQCFLEYKMTKAIACFGP